MRIGRLAAIIATVLLCAAPQPSWAKKGSDSESFFGKKCGAGIGKREVIGTVGGAVICGVAGSVIAGKGDKTEGALIGAAIVGFIGNKIGNKWDEKECEKARAAVEFALASGQSQTWASDDSKRSLSFIIDKSFDQPVNTNLPILQGRSVDLADAKIASGVFEVIDNTNVRSRPSTTESTIYETVDNAAKLAVLAASEDSTWLLVSRDGRSGDGWMVASRLRALPDDPAVFASNQPITRSVQVVSLATSMPCRNMREELLEKGKTKTGAIQTRCLQGDGAWALAEASVENKPAKS